MNTVAKTIRLSDTADQWSRKVHINVRNGKTTMVYRWKDTHSNKTHTQRVTMDDTQTVQLVYALIGAFAHAVETGGRQEQAVELLERMYF